MPSKPSLFKRVFLPVLFLFLLTAFLARVARDKEVNGLFDAHFWKQLWRIGRVMEMAHQDYLHEDKVSYDKLADSALDHLLDGLDPYSDFYNKEKYEDFNNQSRQRTVGIGIEFERRNGNVEVVRVFPNSPADKAGWRPLDHIVAVDNTSISDLTLQAISDLIKGADKSIVRITRERNGLSMSGNLTRGGFDVPSYRDKEMLAHNVGYVHLTTFGEKTGEEFAGVVNELMHEQGGMRGLILDLRDNPGGLVDAAIDVLEPLLPAGTLVMTTRGRNNQLITPTHTQGGNVRFDDKPLIVLVNENTASASEIVAGALKDAHVPGTPKDARRAVILGTRTFGKGVIQGVFDLKDGSGLRLTTEAYFLPLGSSIQDVGIEPNIILAQSEDEHELQRLQRADLRYFEAEQLGADQFEKTYGFSPVPDALIETAAALIRAATPDFVK